MSTTNTHRLCLSLWSGTHTHNYTTLPTRPHKQIAGQGHIHTITQPCLQDHMKQIAGQGHIHTITQPCLQDCINRSPVRDTYTQLHNPAYKTA